MTRTRYIIGHNRFGQNVTGTQRTEIETPTLLGQTIESYRVVVRGETFQSLIGRPRKHLVRVYASGKEERVI